MTSSLDVWAVYEDHLNICSICKTQYDLEEQGNKSDCCPEGQRLIREVERAFWNAIKILPDKRN